MPELPSDFPEVPEVMTNFDHTIDPLSAARVAQGDCFGRHAAWNFNGKVWFQDGRFHEEVWVYGIPQKVISADTLEGLMADVNDEFGYE